ncbi:MAG TPA: hypothetical protein VGB53_07605 [Rubricoccaceae bacterium]|jgi:hypothetical protein
MLALLFAPTPEGFGVGLEWMPVASVLVPAALLLAILWYGSRNAV